MDHNGNLHETMKKVIVSPWINRDNVIPWSCDWRPQMRMLRRGRAANELVIQGGDRS